MMIGTHHLSLHQTLAVESAAASVMSSKLDDFYRYLTDELRETQRVRDSTVSIAVFGALQKVGARRGGSNAA
jgi:hypothetical protein